ncbi:hypothetical protein DENSPDRAFT_830931 [Dentipellis sp. KUC8613]|nr:hypothetical protein DENSPDRAFT_830931 [Dentipellis sp. KUC8613]
MPATISPETASPPGKSHKQVTMVVTRSMYKRAAALKSAPPKTVLSPASVAEVQPVAGPSKPARPVRRERSGVTVRDQIQIKDSRKRYLLRQMKSRAKGHTQGLWCSVVIGNIDASFSEEVIRGIFQDCGRVAAVYLRCIGAGPTLAPEARWYATVSFTTPTGALRALRKHDSTWQGKRIIVTGSVCNLPELSLRPSFQAEKQPPRRLPLKLEETWSVLPDGRAVPKNHVEEPPKTWEAGPWGWINAELI